MDVLGEIRDYVNGKKKFTKIDMDCDLNILDTKTLGSYRGLFKKNGYLRMGKKGIFIVVKKIPESVTYTTLKYPDIKKERDN